MYILDCYDPTRPNAQLLQCASVHWLDVGKVPPMFPKEVHEPQLSEDADNRLFAAMALTLHDEYSVRSTAEHLYSVRQRCVKRQL